MALIVIRMMIYSKRTLIAAIVVTGLLSITCFSAISRAPVPLERPAVMEQTLSSPPIFTYVGQGFDVSTAVYSGDAETFSVAARESDPRGISFSSDGMKMFIIGINDDAIVEYDLKKAYNVSTAEYAGTTEEFSVAIWETNAQELTFNPEGTKMFIIGVDGDAVVEYDLTTAYDVSTATNERMFSVANEEGTAMDLDFSSDGMKMFIVGFEKSEVITYNLATAYDVSTAVYAGAEKGLSVANQESSPRGMTFSSDGMKLFIVGNRGAVVEYGLRTAYDVSNALYLGASEGLSVASQESLPQGITFNPTGTKMFIIGSNAGTVIEYALASIVDYRENSSEDVIDIDAHDGVGGAIDASVRYRLEGADATWFGINASGVITFNAPPVFDTPKDADRNNIYEITVIAGNASGASSQSIHITILNTAPVFTNVGQAFDVSTAVYTGDSKKLMTEVFPTDLTFSPDGMKLFTSGYGSRPNTGVFQYTLRSAYDVSTAQYVSQFSVHSQEPMPLGMALNSNGTKIFVVGLLNKVVVEYSLGIAYDVSTMAYPKTFSIADQVGEATDVTFNADGTKMFISDFSDQQIVEYHLGIGYDISSARYAGVSEEFSVTDQETAPNGLTFNAEGTKMFVIGTQDDAVVEYNLSVAYDVSSARYAGVLEEFRISDQEKDPAGLAFSADGTKMFTIGSTDIVEYTLLSAVDYPENSTDDVFDVDAHDGVGGANDASVTYRLEGPDAELLRIDGSGVITFKAAPDFENPQDMNKDNTYEITVVAANDFKASGRPVHIIIQDANDGPVFTYVGQGFDVSTAVYAGDAEAFSVTAQERDPRGISFSSDGMKMLIVGIDDDAVVEYDLGKAYDISMAVYAGATDEFSVALQETSSQELTFNPDGTKMFIVGADGDAVVEYDLTTAYDVSTATYGRKFSVANEEDRALDLDFSLDGMKMFIVGFDKGSVITYNLGTAYDVSTALYAGASQKFSVADQESSPRGMTFSSDGMKLFIVGSDRRAVVEYILTTAYDVSTAVYAGASEEFSVVTEESLPQGITFNPDGTKMFIIGSNESTVEEYALASIIDYGENSTEHVIDIDANDGLGGANDVSVRYSLKGADALLFDIDASGVITFNSSPDFESPQDADGDNTYVMQVMASNTNGKSYQTIMVHVFDIHHATFTSAPRVTVEENTIGVIYTATTDEPVTFSLGNSKDKNAFTFSTGTGELSFINPPDFEDPKDGDRDNTYLVDVIATDRSSNTSTLEVMITVTNLDEEVPTVITQDVIVRLDAAGNSSITPDQVNNGSSDDIGITSLSLDRTEFTCVDIGTHEVTLTASDNNGNTAQGTAIVTVVDDLVPTTVVAQDLTLELDASGTASITAAQVDNGSSDNCSVTSLTLDQTEFDCSHLGTNMVTLTVADDNGNTAQKTAMITVVDDLVPTIVVAQDLTLELDASGTASTTAAQVDNGSKDNCSVTSLTLSQTEFDCSHLGTNTVTLTVADGSGNMSLATTTVEVIDNLPPVLSSCPTDITTTDPVVFYDLPEAGDNCSVSSTSLVEGLESGSRFPSGTTLVTYEVTDPSGNASTCSFRVIVHEKDMALDIPTAFSPNGDGVNDTWNILNIDRYPKARLRVFDLSGKEVFSSIGYEREWDGSYRSKILPVASYYYVLDLNDPDDQKLKGKITLIK